MPEEAEQEEEFNIHTGLYKYCDPSITVLLSIRFGSSGKVSVSSERDGFGVAMEGVGPFHSYSLWGRALVHLFITKIPHVPPPLSVLRTSSRLRRSFSYILVLYGISPALLLSTDTKAKV